ncbi:ABC transporter ATP-binding protein [Thermoflavimicrobium dichotomicum]|uniref:Branched-chain amino acid transport system ATP-binding protein n=1 Tax=Thermoflavimicrobium dichotomicum TaxID=46223 RepID=A0A1I3S255_9BACL|nr:ABC transporter ATP-binding protein [Thermoflavimicrobium dichotomicum]SFJ51606.1 branched-chain amino acid transport system ATP-binding protein [Thermoflavimicrobium dichotomicum]
MESILKTQNLTITFGGHIVLKEINVSIQRNRFTSIIGPNGAGKTTFFNLLSGQLKPTQGRIFFRDQDVTQLSPDARTRLGIGRSFQITDVFPHLTVLENVRLAVQARAGIHFHVFYPKQKMKELEDKAMEWLKKALLEHKKNELATYLTHGEKRKLEIAMLLALETELLLLDEPTAGMSLEEVPMILELIQSLKDEQNRTILLIEHKMDMIRNLSDQVLVLYQSELLAQGTPEEIMQNELVQSAYLGGDFLAP